MGLNIAVSSSRGACVYNDLKGDNTIILLALKQVKIKLSTLKDGSETTSYYKLVCTNFEA